MHEFDWSYAQVSIAASIRGFETGILAPVVGYIIDRYSPRKLVFTGGIIIALGLFLLSRINSIIGLYGAFFLMAVGLSACSGIMLVVVVGNWFNKKVSIATGIAVSGGAVGGLLVPLVTYTIDVLEWRMAMIVFGAISLAWILPLSLLIRRKPEEYGYLPDGADMSQPVSAENSNLPENNDKSMSVRQVLKSRVFWQIALGFMCHVLVITSVITHIMPYLSSINIPRSTSSLVASGIPLVSILGRLSFGWLGDRFDLRRLAAIGCIITILGMWILGLVNSNNIWLLTTFVVFFGFGFGGPVPVNPTMLRKYFGRARLGIILGLCMGVMMIGMILGPPIAGWIFDTYGSYQNAWYIFMGILFLGAVFLISTPSMKAYHSHSK